MSLNCTPGAEAPFPNPPFPPTFVENISYPFAITDYPSWEIGLKAAAYSLAIAMAVIGNVCVLLTISLNKRMRSSTYLYLINLALSDLIVGLFNMWIHAVESLNENYPFGPTICKVFPFLQSKLILTLYYTFSY